MHLYFAICLIVFAAFMIFLTVNFFTKRRAFGERGIRTMATVTDFRTVNVKRLKAHACTLEYMVDGLRKTAKVTATYRHKVGETVEIAYLPENHGKVMLTEELTDSAANLHHKAILVVTCVFTVGICVHFIPESLSRHNREAFLTLCAQGTAQQIEAKIKSGADVRAASLYSIDRRFDRNASQYTPLLVAAEKNNDPEVLRLLIQAGADVDVKESNETPLMRAARFNSNPEVLNVLIQAGAEVDAKDGYSETALMRAARFNSNPEVLNVLIQAGADVNAENNDGATPLIQAARYNSNPEVLKLLIESGADMGAKDARGWTALSFAAESKEPEIVSLLMASGAEISEMDWDLARKNNRLKDTAVIEELKSRFTEDPLYRKMVADKQKLTGVWGAFDTKGWNSLFDTYSHNRGTTDYLKQGGFQGRADIYTFRDNGSFEFSQILRKSFSNVHNIFRGAYYFLDDVLHIDTSANKLSGDGGVNFIGLGWNYDMSKARYQYSFGEDEEGEYIEITRISYESSDGKKGGPGEGKKYYKKSLTETMKK
jgi:ankyrin repeat protein